MRESTIMRESIEKLLKNKDVSPYKIQNITGLSTSAIYDLRNGKRMIDDITFKNAEKLYHYQQKIEEVGSVGHVTEADIRELFGEDIAKKYADDIMWYCELDDNPIDTIDKLRGYSIIREDGVIEIENREAVNPYLGGIRITEEEGFYRY